MIEVHGLTKRYGGRAAVDGLDFVVEKGCVCGFLGPNGAGKTTTMNIMTGYLAADEGDVIVDGHSIADEPEQAKKRIGYLPELPPLYPDMTVSEYLNFAAELKGVPENERGEQLERIAEMTKTRDVSERLIRNLSKGYRQRVGLAQALVGFPEILILDEPTVGLDPKQIIEIRSLIRELSARHTVILSSHILSEVQEVCDRIFIIHRGKMVASGTSEELERSLSGEPVLELLIKGSAEAIEKAVCSVKGIKQASATQSEEEGALSVRVTSEGDVREDLFNACAKAKLPILEMRRDAMTLEKIFLELTSDALPASEEADEDDGGDDER